MATLLDGVNEVLKRTRTIDVNGSLSSLTNEPKQVYIDLAIQLWNEVIDQLYSTSGMPHPNILAEDTITLATGTRNYSLASDLIQLHFPLLDETNGRYISEYPGGYLALVNDQPQPSNFTGLPLAAAIRPTDGNLYLDFEPTSDENGLVYKYRYDKDTELSAAADTMPFGEGVFRALVPAVAQLWNLNHKGRESFQQSVFRLSMGRAARFLSQKHQRDTWTPKRIRPSSSTDPLNEAQ